MSILMEESVMEEKGFKERVSEESVEKILRCIMAKYKAGSLDLKYDNRSKTEISRDFAMLLIEILDKLDEPLKQKSDKLLKEVKDTDNLEDTPNNIETIREIEVFLNNGDTPAIAKNTPPILEGCIEGIEGPEGVVVTPDKELIVTEYKGHKTSIFNNKGKRLLSFSSDNEKDKPSGVTLDNEKNIIVANCKANDGCIQKFTPYGTLLATVPAQFKYPCGVAFSNNLIYVGEDVDCYILDSNLKRVGSFEGHFNFPRLITCDKAGRVYIADRDNHRIQIFTDDGKFLKIFGEYGKGRGQLNKPWGIAVDDDKVYVSEWDNHRISVFTLEGVFLFWFGEGELLSPNGLAVSDGIVYVCDYGNNRLQMYRYKR